MRRQAQIDNAHIVGLYYNGVISNLEKPPSHRGATLVQPLSEKDTLNLSWS